MFARFALLILVCALVVPKTAWGAHLAGHEQMASASAVHMHHADHAYEDATDEAPVAGEGSDGTSPDQNMVHDHGPSSSLNAALAQTGDIGIGAWVSATNLTFDRDYAANAHSHPESLLRPPRNA
ncbi:hypothetical protein EH30_09255 [Erythrobacter sp. JL475]|nr:hypothetical protein EH30_09255 [Erythrobacter sp. JL475]